MTELLPLSRLIFEPKAIPADSLGVRAELAWLPIDQLYIDPRYQRVVREDGRRNIKRIVERFDWRFFSPLIVSRRGPKQFAIIDGQHRGIGALTHGAIKEVPCLIIEADERAEARAFAIINGQVTSVMATQVFYARLAGCEPKAIELDLVCKAAMVHIQKTPTGGYKVGETLAVGTLESCLEKYGRETLISALQCITQTGSGNAGFVRTPIILAFSEVLDAHPRWRDAGERLFSAIETASIPAIWKHAREAQLKKGGSLRSHLSAALIALLTKELGDGGKAEAREKVKERKIGDLTGRRFTGKPKHAPETLKHLRVDHAAIQENRTLFPRSVISAKDSQRLLISGANSVKLGKKVMKGEWEGYPIFQLSLEERASCPPTCNNRLTCYGNAMPFARRHKHDADLLPVLTEELARLQGEHSDGFVVRLHVLGDFYSLDYVKAWRGFLSKYPALHVFGYTAWPRDSKIGLALADITSRLWDRFAIRFSSDQSLPQGATTIWRKPDKAVVPEGIICPAQSDATACCGTCGMCWSKSAREKTIVFIGHGGIGLPTGLKRTAA